MAKCVLVAVVFIIAWLEAWLFDDTILLHTIFFAPGVILATLYLVDRPARGPMLAAMGLAQMGASLLAGLAPGVALPAALIVAGQAWVGAALLRKLALRGLDFTQARAFASLALVAVLVAPLSGFTIDELLIHVDPALARAALDGFALTGQFRDFGQATLLFGWVLPHAIGIVLAMPLTIAFCAWSRGSRAHGLAIERALILPCNVAVTAAVFYSDGHAYMFLACPTLLWASLRLGMADTAAALLASLLIASYATAHGQGPAEVLRIAPGLRAMYVEFAYLCASICIMPIAVSLETRRRLEAHLARSLELSEQLLNSMHEIVFRTDTKGRWTFLNPAWEQITGYGIAESLGLHSSALLIATNNTSAPADYAGLIRGDVDALDLQLQIRRRDRATRDIAVSVRASRGPAGEIIGTTGTIRDVTEHLRYIEALETSEQRFRQLCDTAPIGIIRCDRHGIITYVNNKLEAIVLVGRAALTGMPWLGVLRIENADLPLHLHDALLFPGGVFEQELHFRDKAGLGRWLIFTASGEYDQHGQFAGFIAAVNDITARKAAESELASRTSELHLLAKNINDVVFRLALDSTCRYATPSAREMLGLDPLLMVGAKAFAQVHPDDAEAVAGAFAQLAHGDLRHCTFAFQCLPAFPQADYIWLEANCRLLRDKRGEPFEVIAVLRDITQRKQLEIEISDARHRAERATLAKSAFIANLSHEIRTPMNGVIGLTDLLLSRELDEPSRRYARLIAESGAAMMHLLNDTLDISKIDSGRLELVNEEFDLHRSLANALSLMHASAGGKALALSLEIAPDMPQMMLGDRLRLRQVLANLIGNAIKFTEAGQIVVAAGREGEILEIRVTDTGIGIPEAQQAAVFEEFVQANAHITSSYGGTGLGLSISRRIAEAMGGTLTLTSRQGAGTTLILRIPAQFVRAPAKPLPAPTSLADEGAGKALRILVAEDNLTNQIIINAMLQRLGHSVALAETGKEAIALVEQNILAETPFDLILMDVQMPEMNGIDATARLRMMGFTAGQLPIIAVTANAYLDDIAICLAAGMQAHLTKPLRLVDLKTALAQWGQAAAAPGPHGAPPQPIRAELANEP